MGLKPIFEQEREFFKEKSGVELPTDCWRSGSKIYLDMYCDKPLYTFKVENKMIKITKNNSKLFENYEQINLQETLNRERERVNKLYNQSYEFLYNYLKEHKDIPIVFNHSGGKDSCLSYDVFKKVIKQLKEDNIKLDYVISFENTSNDTADTYRFIKDNKNIEQDKLKIMNPKEGFYSWIKRKNYFVPTALVRNCCSTFKEGQIHKEYNTKKEYTMILGVRKHESTKRANYDWVMDDEFYNKLFKNHNTNPKLWTNVAPIIEWYDEDVWIYLLNNNIPLNPQYEKGYNRCGCLICPYQSNYTDLLTEKYYPTLWKRWVEDILPKSYENSLIKERFKWSLTEYINGSWKKGVSKVYELTSKNPTKDRIREFMNIMNIKDEEVALKYFNKKCTQCGKKMTPTDIGMNLKLFGRQIDIDNKCKCGKCLQKELGINKKEYSKKIQEFREGGCNLF